MILETERLILRPWNKDDAYDLYTYAKDPDVGPIAGWLPHKNIEESLSVIENILGKECYAVCLKDNKPIGSIELKLNGHNDMSDKDDECELGYWIGKPYWGNGYIPEAVNVIVRYAFQDLHMNTIWCGHYDGNIKSQRVKEKCGFTYYRTTENLEVLGELRTGHTYILTKEQWKSNHDYIT